MAQSNTKQTGAEPTYAQNQPANQPVEHGGVYSNTKVSKRIRPNWTYRHHDDLQACRALTQNLTLDILWHTVSHEPHSPELYNRYCLKHNFRHDILHAVRVWLYYSVTTKNQQQQKCAVVTGLRFGKVCKILYIY